MDGKQRKKGIGEKNWIKWKRWKTIITTAARATTSTAKQKKNNIKTKQNINEPTQKRQISYSLTCTTAVSMGKLTKYRFCMWSIFFSLIASFLWVIFSCLFDESFSMGFRSRACTQFWESSKTNPFNRVFNSTFYSLPREKEKERTNCRRCSKNAAENMIFHSSKMALVVRCVVLFSVRHKGTIICETMLVYFTCKISALTPQHNTPLTKVFSECNSRKSQCFVQCQSVE